MARVHRTATTSAAYGYPTIPLTAQSADVPLTAADATNKEDVTWADGLIIIARNTGVGARTVTITSAPLSGRSGDLTTYNMDAGDVCIFGPFPAAGWRQSDGKLYFEASHAEVLFGCAIIPRV